jgi:glycerol-3-phosphate cytidylyltransferase
MKKIVGFACGFFDIIHPGHIKYLQECKWHCDYLIVGVHEYNDKTKQPDNRMKKEPVQTADERLLMVKSIKYVDEAFLYNGEQELYDYLLDNIDEIDIRFLGEDHKNKPFTGDDLNIENEFTSRGHNYSTTNLINEIIQKRS